MLAGSYMVVARKNSEIGVGALLGVVISQAFGYGLLFDVNFFFRYPFVNYLITTEIWVWSVDSWWSFPTLCIVVKSHLQDFQNFPIPLRQTGLIFNSRVESFSSSSSSASFSEEIVGAQVVLQSVHSDFSLVLWLQLDSKQNTRLCFSLRCWVCSMFWSIISGAWVALILIGISSSICLLQIYVWY